MKQKAIELAKEMINIERDGWENRFLKILSQTMDHLSPGRMQIIQTLIDSIKQECNDDKKKERLQYIYYSFITLHFRKTSMRKSIFASAFTASMMVLLYLISKINR